MPLISSIGFATALGRLAARPPCGQATSTTAFADDEFCPSRRRKSGYTSRLWVRALCQWVCLYCDSGYRPSSLERSARVLQRPFWRHPLRRDGRWRHGCKPGTQESQPAVCSLPQLEWKSTGPLVPCFFIASFGAWPSSLFEPGSCGCGCSCRCLCRGGLVYPEHRRGPAAPSELLSGEPGGKGKCKNRCGGGSQCPGNGLRRSRSESPVTRCVARPLTAS